MGPQAAGPLSRVQRKIDGSFLIAPEKRRSGFENEEGYAFQIAIGLPGAIPAALTRGAVQHGLRCAVPENPAPQPGRTDAIGMHQVRNARLGRVADLAAALTNLCDHVRFFAGQEFSSLTA